MNIIIKIFVLFNLILSISTISSQEQNQEFYQIKIYSLETNEQAELTDHYLKEAYLPALKNQNISNIGVFKPRADSIKKIYLLIPFSSLAQFETLEDELSKDETYLKNGSNYLKASYEKPTYQRIESVLLKAFSDMPKMQATVLKGERKDRIYELRSYESPSETYFKNKVEMFNAGGEVKLFKQLGFNAVFYGEVISGPKMPNLMYMTTFSDMKSHDEHWDAFRAHPDWLKLKEVEKYKHTVSGSTKYLMHPTDYSDL